MSYKVIQPPNLVDGVSAVQLRSEIDHVLADGVNTILIDLQDVTFMNSSAIGALVAMLKAVSGRGGSLSLCSLNNQVRLVFELSRMNQMFDIFADRQEFEQKNGFTIS
ncbi:STAS domain-containing protein [Acaryochloris sp. IP29b_bin.137]|uniref:STAS domain-containing protein n=1 Tax=Acaryochloris sp. IP29b_bin.137 TaxID=2969217 RepID=UPI00261FDBEB|nr:STAS domain-containing protein [Acaryochloris sp. IP29b_bin.137]